MKIIETYSLSKYYGNVKALDGINLSIDKNKIFTLLGPNGAGKTTFLHLLSTVLKPSRGTAYIKDLDIRKDPHKIREIVGIAFQEPQVYWRSTVIDTLKFHASIYGIKGSERDKRIRYVLKILQLDPIARRRLINLSGGQIKKVEVAKVLVQRPEIAFFDEPTAMVDLDGKHAIWDEIKRLKDEGSTIIVATNEIYEAEILSDEVAIFDRGKLMVTGSVGDLKRKLPSGELVEIKVRDNISNNAEIKDELKSQFNPTYITIKNKYIAIRIINSSRKIVDLVNFFMDRGIAIESININEPTLDDVFLHYTKRKIG